MRLVAPFCLLAVFTPVVIWAIPDAVIAQHLTSAKKGEADVNVPMADVVADEIYKDGRINPILWSMGDPLFRAAVDDGELKNPSTNPSLKEAMLGQRKLKAEYLFVVDSTRSADYVKAAAILYRSGKPIWTDTQTLASSRQGKFDLDSTLHSIARTWCALMAVGPLKGLVATTPLAAPVAEPGKIAMTPAVTVPQPAVAADNSTLFRNADGMQKEGKTAQAIGMLRDGVDAQPMDLDRRKKLVEMLMLSGEPVLAAQEARRGAQLLPNGMELRVLAARAWLQAGNGDQAQSDLNEIAVHDPKNADRLLMAQAALFQFKLTQAIDLLDDTIKVRPTGDAYFYRALAEALQANDEASIADVKRIQPDKTGTRYGIGMSALDASIPKISDEVRALFDAANIKQAKELTDGLSFQIARTSATKTFLQGISPEPIHKSSHDRRVLAYNLLTESLTAVQDYLTSKSEDTLSDARLNFSEALRHFRGAREDFLNESKGVAPSEPNP